MYEAILQWPDLGEALQDALFSAIHGRPASVRKDGEVMYEFQVAGGMDPGDGYHPVVVRRRRLQADACPDPRSGPALDLTETHIT